MAENLPMIVIGLIVVVLITAGLTYYVAKAGAPGGNQTAPTITVQGEAAKTVTPDLLTIGITVVGNGSTVADSQADAASKVAALKAALSAQGVNDSDIQTVSFYTSPVYNGSCYNCYPRPIYYGGGSIPQGAPTPAPDAGAESGVSAGSAPTQAAIYPMPPPCDYNRCAVSGYQTVHSLTIKSANVNAGGTLVDAALASSGTKFDYVYFSLLDSTRISIESELQGEAAAAAKAKAQGIANGVGARLGRVVSINPQQNYPYPIYAGKGMAAPSTDTTNSSPPTEIFPSQTTMSSSITVVYELEQ